MSTHSVLLFRQLHQKLCMINCCIYRKLRKEGGLDAKPRKKYVSSLLDDLVTSKAPSLKSKMDRFLERLVEGDKEEALDESVRVCMV